MFRSFQSTTFFILLALFIVSGPGCNDKTKDKELIFDDPEAGSSSKKPIELFVLKNSKGMEVDITNYGAKVVRILTPDKNGTMADIVLGYDHLKDYIKGNPYFGATIGRYANRIANGRFMLDSVYHKLALNNGPNALHGGPRGFHNVVWDARKKSSDIGQSLELNYFSKDGEEGYPGNLTVKVVYLLTEENQLFIDFYATTDKNTIVNMTHHSFFNLTGEGNGDILDHKLKIVAKYYTPVDSTLIPTGEIAPVAGTPFDFTSFRTIGSRIKQQNQQLKYGRGYDHNFVLDREDKSLLLAAAIYDPKSGRSMEVYTKEPGIQFYSGNFLDATDIGKGGKAYQYRSAFCLETQHFPNSPNQPNFPSVILTPKEKYHHTCVYQFGIKK